MERRESDRITSKTSCILIVEERRIPAQLENLSDTGALFRIPISKECPVSIEDLGLDASFVLNTVTPARRYTGEVIRLYFREGSAFIALRFWEKYTELESASS